MTKDWDAVQDEIRALSFNQKKPLEEVKELMERKYKFRASYAYHERIRKILATNFSRSTRAYRMKLKEWGFMRHRPRRTANDRNTGEADQPSPKDGEQDERESSATVEPISTDGTPTAACEKPGGWKVVPNADTVAEPTFLGLLNRDREYVACCIAGR